MGHSLQAASHDGGQHATPDDGAVFVDRRVIAFRAEALCDILTIVWSDAGIGLRACAIRFGTARQVLQVEIEMRGERLERQVSAGELLPILIAYCIGARIALPSQAEKSVRITSGGAVLDCVIAHGSLPRFRRRRPETGRVMGDWER
jgi:hypothetical protein